LTPGGGNTRAEAALEGPILPRALVRFRLPWQWDGAPAVLQSRAHDENGNMQPRRAEWSRQYAAGHLYHCNAIRALAIAGDGKITNVCS
jgi:sulfane dehydrogenase subunit SoxC